MGCDGVIFAEERAEGNTGLGCGAGTVWARTDCGRAAPVYVEGVWRSVTV